MFRFIRFNWQIRSTKIGFIFTFFPRNPIFWQTNVGIDFVTRNEEQIIWKRCTRWNFYRAFENLFTLKWSRKRRWHGPWLRTEVDSCVCDFKHFIVSFFPLFSTFFRLRAHPWNTFNLINDGRSHLTILTMKIIINNPKHLCYYIYRCEAYQKRLFELTFELQNV